jgi:hypothetical protein
MTPNNKDFEMSDFILNGQASGDVASVLLANNMNPAALRPYFGPDGRSYIDTLVALPDGTVEWQPRLTGNANATLRKDQWQLVDQAILKAAKPRLKAVADLRGSGLSYVMPNGMAHTVLQHETQSDITNAVISMDGLRESESDRPVTALENLPLPIIHKDFQLNARTLSTSRLAPGPPLDTTTAELAGRRVAEAAENLLLGVTSTYKYGGGNIYGYTNFPSRLTKTMTAPTSSNHKVTVSEVLAMKTQSQDANYYGPWFCYCSTSWDEFLDEDYSDAKGDNTLRDRIGKIEGIDTPTTLDYLPAKTMILVQKAPEVAREVIGMDITTVQWESHGGMQLNFKVMAILVPQLRADFYGNTGIVHGSHA